MQKFKALVTRYLQKEWVILLLVVLTTIPAFKTLFFVGYFNHHDDLQVMRIYEMEKCFHDGQIPCRWIPDMGYGYGYPLFNYYPPFPFYVGTLIRFITPLQIVDTVKVLFALQIIVAAVLMYLFARQWWGRWGGILSAVFYTYAPYHAVDLYVRGAHNEAWAMAFAPGVGWAMTRLWQKQSVNNVVLLALMTSGMLLSHNVMVMIFAPLLALFALLLTIEKRSIHLLLHYIASGILALMLCAFFTLPSVLEQKYAHIETLFIGFFNYTVHFVTLNQLFISRYWGYGGSTYGPNDQMAFPIGWLHWGGVFLVMAACLYFLKKRKFRLLSVLTLFGFYFWFTAFLTHERSYAPIWAHVDILKMLQFPWRFLSTVAFTSSFLIGSLFLLPLTPAIRKTLFFGLLISIFAINIEFFHVEHKYRDVTDSVKLSGKLWELQRTAGIFDYLPIYANVPPGRPAPGEYQVLSGSPAIAGFQKGSASVAFSVAVPTASRVRLNIFDYPFWKVFIDGQEVPHDHDNYLGLITFDVPQGVHTVLAKLTDTPLRMFGNVLSLLTMLGLAGYYGLKFLNTRRQTIGNLWTKKN